jgi:septum formation protein
LKKLGLNPLVIEPNIEEESLDDPYRTVKVNSYRKALSVIELAPRHSVIIGADTVVYSPTMGTIGKPNTLLEAEEILLKLRGKWHTVITGVCIIDRETLEHSLFTEETRVKRRNYDIEEIRQYLTSVEPLGKAGAYAIPGLGLFLVEAISGDYYNVVGLPLSKLNIELRRFGINIFTEAVKAKITGEHYELNLHG